MAATSMPAAMGLVAPVARSVVVGSLGVSGAACGVAAGLADGPGGASGAAPEVAPVTAGFSVGSAWIGWRPELVAVWALAWVLAWAAGQGGWGRGLRTAEVEAEAGRLRAVRAKRQAATRTESCQKQQTAIRRETDAIGLKKDKAFLASNFPSATSFLFPLCRAVDSRGVRAF